MSDWVPPSDLDSECLELCKAMNAMPGIRTIEACCGHGERSFKVWFLASALDALPPLLYWFDACHSGVVGWSVQALTDCGMSPVRFLAEGPVGGYEGARLIAVQLAEWIERAA